MPKRIRKVKYSYFPDFAKYEGGGKCVFTETENLKLEQRGTATYLSNATLADVQAYIANLKANDIKYAAYAAEDIDVNEWGTMTWYGINADKTFSIAVNFFAEPEEIIDNLYNTGAHKYNLQIQVNNYDIFN